MVISQIYHSLQCSSWFKSFHFWQLYYCQDFPSEIQVKKTIKQESFTLDLSVDLMVFKRKKPILLVLCFYASQKFYWKGSIFIAD